jgi:hypothetical protein
VWACRRDSCVSTYETCISLSSKQASRGATFLDYDAWWSPGESCVLYRIKVPVTSCPAAIH